MSNVGLHAAKLCGLYYPEIEWERRDYHDPAQRCTITVNGHELLVVKLGYRAGATVPLYAVAYEGPVDERLPGHAFKLSLVVRVWVVKEKLISKT